MGDARTDSACDVAPDESAARLSRAVARGEPAAVEEFYRAWFDRVFRMARAATGRDESFCLDVVQDVMMKAIRSMKPLRGDRELRAWMGKTTVSCAIDSLRSEQRRARREKHAASSAAAITLSHSDEQIEWLRTELNRMDAADRALVTLRYGRDATLDATGEASGMSGDAAHGRLRRAVRALIRSASEMLP